jgi:alpha,alpha-trehalase
MERFNYGYFDKAQEVIYRWLWLITKNAVEYNGTIPENSILKLVRKVFAEYGNVGTESIIFPKKGFIGKCIIPIRFANFE